MNPIQTPSNALGAKTSTRAELTLGLNQAIQTAAEQCKHIRDFLESRPPQKWNMLTLCGEMLPALKTSMDAIQGLHRDLVSAGGLGFTRPQFEQIMLVQRLTEGIIALADAGYRTNNSDLRKELDKLSVDAARYLPWAINNFLREPIALEQ